MNIGFIGLGRMGHPMVANLSAAGRAVTAFDMSPDAMDRVNSLAGVSTALNPGEVAARSEVLFTVLPNDQIVRDVYTGSDGILNAGREGLVTCDCSTVSPACSEELSAALAAKGICHMDTPMLGSQPQAVEGEIFFIAAGDEAKMDTIAPLLEIMGKSHMYVGASGMGNRIKLIHNMLGAVNSVAAAETLALCKSAGIDAETLYQVVCQGNGMARTTYFEKRAQRVSQGNFDPTFTLGLMFKDTELALKLIGETKVPTPIMNETRATYEEGSRAGWADEDFSAVSHVIEKRMGKKLFGD